MGTVRNIDVRVRLQGTTDVSKGLSDLGASFLKTKVGWAAVAAAIVKGAKQAAKYIKEFSEDAIDFESALAGVAKTTNFSEVGLRNFANQIMDLSERIPVTATELANLAEIAGQLGVSENNLVDFVEVVAAMGVSTNMSAEEAATGFARLANIFGTASEDYSKMGSALVDLGNNFATTESEIMDMALRMAGMGAVVGMSEADIIAYSTALSSIGVEANAGGTAMQKLFQQFEMATKTGKKLESFADVTGLTAKEFRKLWESSPAAVVNKFLTGLKDIEENGGSAIATLADLEIKEARLTRAVLGLANADELVVKAVGMSNTAWQEDLALVTEAGKRYETTASRIQMAQNKIDNAQVVFGDTWKDVIASNQEYKAGIAAGLTESLREIDLADEISAAQKEFDTQKDSIDANATAARNLVGVLRQLGDPTLLDIDGQKDYRATLEALTAIVPDVSKLWDRQTLSINGGTDAINKAVDAAQNLATAELDLERAREAADAYSIVEEHVNAKRIEYQLAKAELEKIQKDFNVYQESRPVQGIGVYGEDWNFTDKMWKESEALAEKSEEVNKLQQEIEKSEAYLAEYSYVVDDYEKLTGKAIDSAAEYANVTNGVNDAQRNVINGLTYLSDELETIIEEYHHTKEEILAVIDSTISGFNEIKLPEIETPQDMLSGLESQLEFIEAYRTALAKAQELGLDPSVIAELADGSTESYSVLASLVSGTEEDVDAINQKLAEVGVAKDTLATDLATAVVGLEESASSVVELANGMVTGADVSDSLYSVGASDVQSLINGINDKLSSLRIAVGKVNSITASMGSGETSSDGSHAAGLGYVPHDGYIAQLHRGEMVLTALEAKAYRAEQFTNAQSAASSSGTVSRNYNETINATTRIGTAVFYENADVNELANRIADRNKRISRARGAY